MIKILKVENQYFGEIQNTKRQAFIGKNGLISPDLKREGDKCTPFGTFDLGDLYYREDRLSEVEREIIEKASFTKHKITQKCGWSDDVKDPAYNQYVQLPYDYSHEKLWMESSHYDAFVVINYNIKSIFPGKGSAIFMHIVEIQTPYTEGCIGFQREDFFQILKHISSKTYIQIGEN